MDKNGNGAIKWYRRAAEQGHRTAQHFLGYRYAFAVGVVKDKYEAIKWYSKAAQHQSPPRRTSSSDQLWYTHPPTHPPTRPQLDLTIFHWVGGYTARRLQQRSGHDGHRRPLQASDRRGHGDRPRRGTGDRLDDRDGPAVPQPPRVLQRALGVGHPTSSRAGPVTGNVTVGRSTCTRVSVTYARSVSSARIIERSASSRTDTPPPRSPAMSLARRRGPDYR